MLVKGKLAKALETIGYSKSSASSVSSFSKSEEVRVDSISASLNTIKLAYGVIGVGVLLLLLNV